MEVSSEYRAAKVRATARPAKRNATANRPTWRLVHAGIVTLIVAASSYACGDSDSDGGDASNDAGCARDATVGEGEVDVLLVIDTSADSPDFQALLQSEMTRMLQMLQPVGNVQIGAITADLGAGNANLTGCVPGGDGGQLQAEGNLTVAGCLPEYDRFQVVTPSDDLAAVAQAVSCVAFRFDGCGVEQPLEAMRLALQNEENQGFFRVDATLAVLVLSDEDDCSAADPELFDAASATYTGDVTLRCIEYPDALHPADRYVEALTDGRSPDDLVFMAIVGVPPELETEPLGDLANDAQIRPMVDPTGPSGMRASCMSEAVGAAFPPQRLVAVAAGLESRGAAALVGSVCRGQDGFQSHVDRFADEIVAGASSRCVP